jgi:hypothetical protein
LVDFHVIWWAGDAIEGDIDAIIFNPIASRILKWLRFELLRWMHYLHHSTLLTGGLGLESIVGSDRAFLVAVVMV